jgi:aspartate racemase
MIRLTAQAAAARLPDARKFGLMATTGTVKSGLYGEAFGERGLELLIPTPEEQELVMAAVYGEDGVKAGRVDGPPRERADRVMAALVARGAEAIILGCTELPLLYPDAEQDGVPMLNSTQVLAEACVINSEL